MPPFITLTDRIRKDPLGPARVNVLRDNLLMLRGLAASEHIISTGEHNAWDIPRVCRRVGLSAGPAYAESPASSDITSITTPGTGRVVLNLASSRFTIDMRLQVNAYGEAGKPVMTSYTINSATQVEVQIQELSSALGAGNAWAALDSNFDVAIHSTPLAQGSWSLLPIRTVARQGYRATVRNAGLQNTAELYAALVGEHNESGTHNVRQVAKFSTLVRYAEAGGDYDVIYDSGGSVSVSRASEGVIEVTFSALPSPLSAFVSPDWTRQNSGGATTDIFNMFAVPQGTTRYDVHIFKYDVGADTWDVADGDFWLEIYGS